MLILAVFIDRAIKWAFMLYWPSFVFVNNGLIFSLQANFWLILAVSGVLIAVVAAFWFKSLGFSLILAGAISNFIDRIAFGGVIDYIKISTGYFNFSDILIIAGVLCVLFTKQNISVDNNKLE